MNAQEKLYKELEALDDKADWEGGLSSLILGYGGRDLFPVSCQDDVDRFSAAYDEIVHELRRLSEECGYGAGSW